MDPKSSYTGRKIRIVGNEAKDEVEVITEKFYDNSKKELLQTLNHHLYGSSEKHLICISGKKSDVVVSEALKELAENTANEKKYIIPKSYCLCRLPELLTDVPTLFALAIYSCIKSEERLRFLTEGELGYELVSKLYYIVPDASADRKVTNLAETESRLVRCRELIDYIRSFVDVKFVWNVEVSDYINGTAIYNLSQMSSINLTIILNYMRKFEPENFWVTHRTVLAGEKATIFNLLTNYADCIVVDD